jgi:4-alpha-glucanotransferase
MHGQRCAGILIPLFSIRTAEDFGRGEIGGLIPMAELALAMGHRLIQLLPVDETAPGETSPYSAMSVFAIDPVYVSAHMLSGVDAATIAAARVSAGAGGAHVDQLKLRAAKFDLLAGSWRDFTERADAAARAAFAQFVETNRHWLDNYALFRALKEHFGWCGWEKWPAGLRRHETAATASARRELAGPVAMYSWFQFVAQGQWTIMRAQLAARGVMLGGDLAFSPGRESAEVWANQELFDLDRSAGAPPDAFSATGQRWGLPMPNWQRMRAGGFALMRARVRRARALYDVLRVDHVVGLFRTYGYSASEESGGTFDPPDEDAQRAQGMEILLAIIAEADPMRIIAEDLGVIPPFVRETLCAMTIPGYKVVRWERENWGASGERIVSPATYPEISLATTGTHDTETLREWWDNLPLIERSSFAEALGIADRVAVGATPIEEATLDAILEATYSSPARFAIVPIQDLFGWTARINTPGTVNEDNWTWRLPFDAQRACDDTSIRARVNQLRLIAQRTDRF